MWQCSPINEPAAFYPNGEDTRSLAAAPRGKFQPRSRPPDNGRQKNALRDELRQELAESESAEPGGGSDDDDTGDHAPDDDDADDPEDDTGDDGDVGILEQIIAEYGTTLEPIPAESEPRRAQKTASVTAPLTAKI
jgi:hypothetical protein